MSVAQINLNDVVRVRLTDHGRQVYRQHVEGLLGGAVLWTPASEDADGWSDWSLWDLMSVFGAATYMGGPLCFGTEIRLAQRSGPVEPSLGTNGAEAPRDPVPEPQGGEQSHSPDGRSARIEALEWAIGRTLFAGDIDPPERAAPFWFREQLLRDAGLTMERCKELMDLHRGEARVARL